jgi:hypothetical protein
MSAVGKHEVQLEGLTEQDQTQNLPNNKPKNTSKNTTFFVPMQRIFNKCLIYKNKLHFLN